MEWWKSLFTNRPSKDLDGVDYKQSISDLYAHDMSMGYIFSRLSDTFMTRNYRTKLWSFSNPNDFGTSSEYNFWWVMNNYFVSRWQYEEYMARKDNELTNVKLRLEALENILGEENVLKGRLKVAKEYNLTSITYNGTTYYNVDYGFFSLKTIE